jgi:very-short-patch-repair endonuclease
MSLQIKSSFPGSIGFTIGAPSPLHFGSLELVNEGLETQENLVLEFSSVPSFCERKTWNVDALVPQSALPIVDCNVKLTDDFFLKLSELTACEVQIRLMKGDEVLANHRQTVNLIPPPPHLSLTYDHSINYAFQQNSIPVVKELRLRNNGVARKDLVLRVTTEPAFAPPVEIRLQSIEPAGEFRVSPLDLKLSHDFLAELNEKVAGWLKVEMLESGEIVQSITEPITLLSRNEWCGLVALPEILAAFVLPNDPTVMTILSRASDVLKEATGRSELNGYQDKSRKRAWEQIAAIYKSIGELGIRYINPPASFETSGQKVRFPSEIVSQRFGTCLDLALLCAACCEQSGLRPFVFIHDGHAYAGCWLEERSLPGPAGDDLQQVRKLAADELVTVFETTTVTNDQPGTLNDAELLAKPHLLTEKPFRLALDVHASRSARISPLPVPGQAPAVPGAPGASPKGGASSGLGSREFADEITITDGGPAKPANRIDLWKSRLLDLSLRNRLLNFRETKSTIRILSEPEHVEDELAAERELSLRPKPKMMSEEDPRNAATFTKEQRADALKDHLQDELRQGRLHTHLDENEHARRLTELFRSARNALDENGTNTLFAAVGILEWRETQHSDRVHRAPLLLVPVELKRQSVLEGFKLRRIDEETRLNVTLMEMLRQSFRKEVPGLDPLPEDVNGVNVDHVLRIFREAVRDLAGWEVKSEVWLSQFSFTKFLLWKDLADRLEDLTKNRVVNHLIHQAGTPIPNPSVDIRDHELDDRFHPREVLCPRSADSSQLAAVMAAADGHDFVLEGPPGTGKSQTITNIIAHCLAVGKRVLFVAEKRAALDVVHRRLREDGLEPFCLELHSNKTGKADVLAQFDRSLKFAEEFVTTDWEHRAAELERLRTELNSYARALHKSTPCGLSAHHCLDYLLARRDESVVKMDGWTAILETSAETLDRARQVARLMQERTRPLMPLADHALAPLACEEWSPGWAERTLDQNTELAEKCKETSEATRDLLKWMQLDRALSHEDLQRLDSLLESLLSPEPVGPAFATTPWPQLAADLDLWISLAKERSDLRASLAPLHIARPAGTVAVQCEGGTQEAADALFQKGRELEVLLKAAASAADNLLWWLQAPVPQATREELVNLAALAESLLDTDEVGAGFATTPWETWSPSFDRWISLVRERSDLRAKLHGYDEAKLLALDLDLLHQKWKKAQSTWFLPKMLNTGSVRGNLRKALPSKVKPDESGMGAVVSSAIRLREINQELASIYITAESLLGKSWKGGEPDSAQMARIRSWGETLHQRMGKVAGTNGAWLSSIQNLLVGHFQSGPVAFAPGKPDGDRLIAMRDSFNAFDAACESFTTAGALNRVPLEEAADHLPAVSTMLQVFLQAAPRLREIDAAFSQAAPTAQACLGVLWEGGEPDAQAVTRARVWGETLHARMLAFAGEDFGWLGSFRQLLASLFTEGPAVYAANTVIGGRMARFRDRWSAFNESLNRYVQELRLRREELDTASDHLAATFALTERVAGGWSKIREWCSWQKVRQEAIRLGLTPVVEKLETAEGTPVEVTGLFERSFRRGLLFAIIEKESALREFFGNEHNERIERFRELDEHLAKLSKDLIRVRLAAGIPRDDGKDDIPKAEIGLLRKEIAKRMRHIPVRQLIGRIPTLLPRLKPCVLMSPLSVAQYLDASHETFDVVIFDEASQIPVWDAVGAIARGRQLIVVGDPKQLPPTNFFSTNTDDEDDLTPEEHKDLESILDELMTHGLRRKRLRWHYRSRHEGLITFSNRQYYDNDLLTFPSPEMEHGGVRFRHLPNARYDKGKSRTNRQEAEALVQELVSRLRNPSLPRRSYGVVTFSQAQQALVENLLDEERRKYPEIELHFGDEPPVEGEPVFVKNLENVQGDERDVIFFSICYGFDEAGKLSMNFGPLNRDGGERRLNVAVTRSKHEVLVFSGLRGDQIDLTRTRARGVKDLKYFLEYAERGPRALIAATSSPTHAEADSEFERMVADRLRSAGYDVHHQVGCSGYRLDLAVVDSKSPGRYLLGVECDGATYHRAATARDRDKLRQAVLEDLGWKLHRIWSTDWWHNANSEMEKLLAAISSAEDTRDLELAESEATSADAGNPSWESTAGVCAADSGAPAQTLPTAQTRATEASIYEVTDLTSFSADISPARFYESDYEPTLKELIGHVVEREGPILDGLLVNRIARAHGLLRSGRIINDRVLEIAKRHFHIKTDHVGGSFVWHDEEMPESWAKFRTPASEESTRRIEEIAFEELRSALPSKPVTDVPLEIARIFGIRRLAAAGRARLESVIRMAAVN